MKRFVALCIVAVAFATAPAFAGFQEGVDAFERGDYKTALREFQHLAEQGDADAQYLLGVFYKDGEGVPQDYKEAVKWYTLSAEQGHADAQHNLAIMYGTGEGVLQDYVRAHMWFNLAASNGSEKASGGRDIIETGMTPLQIEKAQGLARACVAKDYKGC